MRHFLAATILLCTLVSASTPAESAALFSSDPHILALGDRQQIVLFAGEPIDGAMATRRADGSWDIVVPDAKIDESLGGRSFFGPPVGGEGAATQVSFDSTQDGDVRLRVRSAGDVVRVLAYAVGSPPRLMVDLLGVGAKPAPAKNERRVAKADKPRRATPEKKKSAPKATKREPAGESAKKEAVAEPTKKEAAQGRANSDPVGKPAKKPVKPTPEPSLAVPETEPPSESTVVALHADERSSTSRPPETPATLRPGLLAAREPEPLEMKPRAAEPPGAAPSSSSPPAGVQVANPMDAPTELAKPAPAAPRVDAPQAIEPVALGEDELDGSGRIALALAENVDDRERHCQFMRVAGVPYCAPNGDAPGYVETAYTAGFAHRISAGATWLAPVRSESAAGPFLEADRDFILRARKGWLLDTIRVYQRAVRLQPDFPDAIRAHMNVALIYTVLGFAPELEMTANDETNPAHPFAAALLGDQRLDEGRFREAGALYQRAAVGGGMASCLAARGLAGLALAEGRTDRAQEGMSGLRDLCPRGLIVDPDTERLRARIALSSGDPDGALATLEQVENRLKRSQRGDILLERASIAEGAGRIDAAREAWTALESGRYGPKLEAQGAISLARLEGTKEAVDDGLSRLSDLPPEDRARARHELLIDVSGDALDKGDDLSAVAMILGEGLDPAGLAPREQVELAAAYRRLGLLPQAEETLTRVEVNGRGGLPETYWAERGSLALAIGDLGAAEATLTRWQRSRGGNPSAGELELRARVLAGRNAGQKPIEGVLRRLAGIDRRRAIATRWQVAGALAERDPAVGIALLEQSGQLAKLPKLSDDELAQTLWSLGRGAEDAGESTLALAAYRALGLGLPGTPRGAEASYRAARLLEIEQEFPAARRAFDRAATHPQGIDRRLAEAASAYHGVVRPWGRPEEDL